MGCSDVVPQSVKGPADEGWFWVKALSERSQALGRRSQQSGIQRLPQGFCESSFTYRGNQGKVWRGVNTILECNLLVKAWFESYWQLWIFRWYYFLIGINKQNKIFVKGSVLTCSIQSLNHNDRISITTACLQLFVYELQHSLWLRDNVSALGWAEEDAMFYPKLHCG